MTTKRVRVGIFGVGFFLSVYASPAHAQNGPNDSLFQTFGDIAFTVASAITQLIVLMIDLMVPIMTYNDFVNNPVVKAGWAIVRDTVNMFFVVILIIIAFGTIFGAERFKWQQQVPRLLIMAIVINFSKTLCGIMIDFGQVIMLTFANALREIAAGNFIQLLGLTQIYNISQNSAAISAVKSGSDTKSWQAFDFLASGLAAMVLTMSVLAILIIMVAVLLFRIIMLWVLVVIAPLAWFVRGAEGIIQSNAYSEWWAEFKCLVGIGPVLAFFLWLTLAVAGAGNIAANSGFNVSSTSNSADFTSSIFELNNFLSFLIGMALLTAGLQAAVQFCGSAKFSGGKIGGLIKTGQGLPQAFVKTTAGLAAKGGSLGLKGGAWAASATPGLVRGIGKRLPVTGLSTVGRDTSAGLRGAMWRAGARVGGDTVVGKWARGKAIDVQTQHRAEQFKDVDTEKEAMKTKGSTWKKNRMEQNLRNPPSSDKGRAQDIALFEEMMGDKQMQKDLGREKVEQLWQRHGANYRKMANGNSAKTADINGFEKTNADFVLKAKSPEEKQKWLERNVKNADDIKGLANGAWGDADVQARAANIQTTHGGESMTALEAAKRGHYGVDAKTNANTTPPPKREGSQEHLIHEVDHALGSGDTDHAKELVSKMGEKFHATDNTDEKLEMLRTMDNTIGKLEQSKSPGAAGVIKRLKNVRETAERVWQAPAETDRLEKGETGEAYAREMKNASPVRKANAVDVLNKQETKVQQQKTQVENERVRVTSDKQAVLATEIENLASTLAQARAKVEKELMDNTRKLQTDWLAAVEKKDTLAKKSKEDQKNPALMDNWKKESADEAQKASEVADALKAQLDAAKAKSDMPDDRKKAAEDDERVKAIRVELEEKKTKGIDEKNDADLQALTAQIKDLSKHLVEIQSARNKLS
jgi:hypothetical protein